MTTGKTGIWRLKRHNVEERPEDSRKPPADPYKTPGDLYKNEQHWFTKDGGEKEQADLQRNKGTPLCMYCKMDHRGDGCTTFNTLESRRKFFFDNQLCYNIRWSSVEVVVASSAKEDTIRAYLTGRTLLCSLYSLQRPKNWLFQQLSQ